MSVSSIITERRTSVDDVFDYLYEQISTLQLKPGDRISEAEIAAQFGVSRQPVRDAFSRLANQDLLLIRPQRATEVRRFSMHMIKKARFVRAAIEKEVLNRAATLCDTDGADRLDAELAKQDAVVASGKNDGFGELDYNFHRVLCDLADASFVFDVILDQKAKVDRLCQLSLTGEQRIPVLVEDHRTIAEAVKAHDAPAAVAAGALHLSRLDETIDWITQTNANYFEREND